MIRQDKWNRDQILKPDNYSFVIDKNGFKEAIKYNLDNVTFKFKSLCSQQITSIPMGMQKIELDESKDRIREQEKFQLDKYLAQYLTKSCSIKVLQKLRIHLPLPL